MLFSESEIWVGFLVICSYLEWKKQTHNFSGEQSGDVSHVFSSNGSNLSTIFIADIV